MAGGRGTWGRLCGQATTPFPCVPCGWREGRRLPSEVARGRPSHRRASMTPPPPPPPSPAARRRCFQRRGLRGGGRWSLLVRPPVLWGVDARGWPFHPTPGTPIDAEGASWWFGGVGVAFGLRWPPPARRPQQECIPKSTFLGGHFERRWRTVSPTPILHPRRRGGTYAGRRVPKSNQKGTPKGYRGTSFLGFVRVQGNKLFWFCLLVLLDLLRVPPKLQH